jgi:hypothetical protein
MNEPERLRHSSDDPFTRELLASARDDRPPAGAAQRALLVLSAGTAAASAEAAACGVPAGSGAAGKGGLSLLVKALGVGLLGAAALLVATGEPPRLRPATAPRISPPQVIQPAPAVIAQVAATPEPVEKPRVPRPRARRAEPGPAPQAATPAPAPAEDDTLAQLAELGAVRRALTARAPDDALARLDRFALRYPGSLLSEEAGVLRIDALVDAGRTREALAEARAFLQVRPHSAYAQRIRTKLALR